MSFKRLCEFVTDDDNLFRFHNLFRKYNISVFDIKELVQLKVTLEENMRKSTNLHQFLQRNLFTF